VGSEKKMEQEEAAMKTAKEEAAHGRGATPGEAEKEEEKQWKERKERIQRGDDGGVGVVEEKNKTKRGTPTNETWRGPEEEDTTPRSAPVNTLGAEFVQGVRPSSKTDGSRSLVEIPKEPQMPHTCSSSSSQEALLSSSLRPRTVSLRTEQENAPTEMPRLCWLSSSSEAGDGVARVVAGEKEDRRAAFEVECASHACTRAALRVAEERVQYLQQYVHLLSERCDSLTATFSCGSHPEGDQRWMVSTPARREEEHSDEGIQNAREIKTSLAMTSFQKRDDDMRNMQGSSTASCTTEQKMSAPSCRASTVVEEDAIFITSDAGAQTTSSAACSPPLLDVEPDEKHRSRDAEEEKWVNREKERKRSVQGTCSSPTRGATLPSASSLITKHTQAEDCASFRVAFTDAQPTLSAGCTPLVLNSLAVHENDSEEAGGENHLHDSEISFLLADAQRVERGLQVKESVPFEEHVSSSRPPSPVHCQGIPYAPLSTEAEEVRDTTLFNSVGEEEKKEMHRNQNALGAFNRLTPHRPHSFLPKPILHASETEVDSFLPRTIPSPSGTGEQKSISATSIPFSSLQKSGVTPKTPHTGCLCCRELLRALTDKEHQLLRSMAECQYWKKRCEE